MKYKLILDNGFKIVDVNHAGDAINGFSAKAETSTEFIEKYQLAVHTKNVRVLSHTLSYSGFQATPDMRAGRSLLAHPAGYVAIGRISPS